MQPIRLVTSDLEPATTSFLTVVNLALTQSVINVRLKLNQTTVPEGHGKAGRPGGTGNADTIERPGIDGAGRLPSGRYNVKIACVGGGPAGLYFALLMKLGSRDHDVTVLERDREGSADGWGVTFGGDVLDELYRYDPVSAREIGRAAFRWTDQVVDIGSTRIRRASSSGYSIKRHRFLGIMASRARDLGVHIEFGHEITSPGKLPEANLIVACDGANSTIRRHSDGLQTSERLGLNKYIWLGTDKVFESFIYAFAQTDSGWIWAYAYGVDAGSSTFIVECSPETWSGLGLDIMSPEDSLGLLERLFARQLDGRRLARQARDGADVRWLSFKTISNRRWYDGRIVLAGDAAHTTHYSIGWGTKLAIEDAIALAANLRRTETVETALRSYEAQRRAALGPPRDAARLSAQWFENLPRYIGLEPRQFSMLLDGRQSPVLPHVSTRLHYEVLRATENVALLKDLRRRAGPRIKAIYGRRDPTTPLPPSPFANAELRPMRIHLISPHELGPAEIAAWHGMQQATPPLDNPFLSPEFATAVGRARPQARVAVLMDGNSTVGFFPFERHRLGLGQPIGGRLSHYQGLVHAPGAEWNPRELLRGCGLAAWRFDNLIVGQQPFKPYHVVTAPSPVIDLTDGFDNYSAELRVRASRFCRELARKARKLGCEVGDLRVVTNSRESGPLHKLIAWKSEQYRRTGCADSFRRPWMADLLEALLVGGGCHADGLLSVLYAGDQPVAAQFGLRSGTLLVGWYTAYDPRFARYSPGLIHLRRMTEHLAASGIRTISLGKGSRKYTKPLKNHDVLLAEGIVNDSSLLGAVHDFQGRSAKWVMRSVREHPRLHSTTDRVLRRSGLSRLIYGRI
jgi:CelD/BcsL family acetyltransferase involved in cellulose biosynthesis/2-polyprenyl-6-methoxyphenol hydroxylase-like FAD-dependent oxidoreductase